MERDARFGLHAKTAVVDRKRVVIGSFNLDPRSTHLKSELLLVIDDPGFARQMADIIERDMELDNSWHVSLDQDGELQWVTRRHGRPLVLHHEPDVSFGAYLRMLPYMLFTIESIL